MVGASSIQTGSGGRSIIQSTQVVVVGASSIQTGSGGRSIIYTDR